MRGLKPGNEITDPEIIKNLTYSLTPRPDIGKDVIEVKCIKKNTIIFLDVKGGGMVMLFKDESYITDDPKINTIQRFDFDSNEEMNSKVKKALSLLQGNNQ